MILLALILIPVLGIFIIFSDMFNPKKVLYELKIKRIKATALTVSIINLLVSLIIYILFDFSSNQFQFVQEYHEISYFHIYLGVDGLSIYFVLLTTIITPIALLSNWTSISENIKSYVIIILLLESLLLAVFLVLDILLFYIFFESILPPLFLLIGIFGSSNKVRASFYLFLYTFNLKCKKAKHRGSPKASITKVLREIFLLTLLMIKGMVTSLKMNKDLFMKWVIAVLSQTDLFVKEQRVDGFSKSRNLDFVRCTLVAGKPVFERTIYSYSDNKKSYGLIRSLHAERFFIDPMFITGLVDAEGCFTLGFYNNNNYKMGYQIQAIFKITLHKKDYDLLCKVRDFFLVGKLTKHGETTLQYTVKSLRDLDIIISHLEKYPLLSEKKTDYLLFKTAISSLRNKKHLSRQGFNEILCTKASINLGLSDELKIAFPDIKPISKPSTVVEDKNITNLNWLAGLASGDGCFYISIRNTPNTKLGKSIVLKFSIVQHSRDIELIKLIISTLKCGRVELYLKQSAVYFVVTDFKDIFEKIIPLFDKYAIRGVKSLDYIDFKKVALLINDKKHLSEKGLSDIQSLKLNMNKGR